MVRVEQVGKRSGMMNEQISILQIAPDEDVAELKEQVDTIINYSKNKRKWENAFQKWSDKQALDDNCCESYGACGYGSMCDYCEDNSYGRPCVRALNKMLRETGKSLDYTDYDFRKIWGASWSLG